MTKYNYKCEKCGNIEEVEMPMNDKHPDKVKCSKCEGVAYRVFGIQMQFPFWMKHEEEGFNYNERRKTVF